MQLIGPAALREVVHHGAAERAAAAAVATAPELGALDADAVSSAAGAGVRRLHEVRYRSSPPPSRKTAAAQSAATLNNDKPAVRPPAKGGKVVKAAAAASDGAAAPKPSRETDYACHRLEPWGDVCVYERLCFDGDSFYFFEETAPKTFHNDRVWSGAWTGGVWGVVGVAPAVGAVAALATMPPLPGVFPCHSAHTASRLRCLVPACSIDS